MSVKQIGKRFRDSAVEIKEPYKSVLQSLRTEYDPYDACEMYLNIIEELLDDYDKHPSPDAREQLKRQIEDYQRYAVKVGVKPYAERGESS